MADKGGVARQPEPAQKREDGSAGAQPSPGWPPQSPQLGSGAICDRDTLEVVAWLAEAHRIELSKLHALVIRYREFIEDNGLDPPDDSGQEALERFRHVFEKAGHLDELQHPELLADWWIKAKQAA